MYNNYIICSCSKIISLVPSHFLLKFSFQFYSILFDSLQVAPGGPGESSGLLQGDVLVEVNGQNVEEECIEDVILLMKEAGNLLFLLVIDRSGYEWMKKNGKPIVAIAKPSEKVGFTGNFSNSQNP